MPDTTTIEATFNLDTSEAVEGVLNLKGQIQSLGDSENFTGLLEGMTRALPAIAALGAAIYAVKTAIDLTFEGEKINAISDQFNTLAAQAGISGDALKKAMEEASNGLIGTTDQLEIANKAFVTLGTGVQKLPELMELARKYSLIYGQDTKTTFNDLLEAIERGNQKMLKRIGLHVDLNTAYKSFADATDKSVNALTEEEKAQARLNAVLAEGEAKHLKSSDATRQATNAATQMKVAMEELKETVAKAFADTLGPMITNAFQFWTERVKEWRTSFVAHFGGGIEQAKAQADELRGTIISLGNQLEEAKHGNFPIGYTKDSWIKQLEKDTVDAEQKLKALEAQIKKTEPAKPGEPAAPGAAPAAPTSSGMSEEQMRKLQENERKAFEAYETIEQSKLKTHQKIEAELQKLDDEGAQLSKEEILDLAQVDIQAQEDKEKRREDDAIKIKRVNEEIAAAKIAADKKLREIEASPEFSPTQKLVLEAHVTAELKKELEGRAKIKKSIEENTELAIQKIDEETAQNRIDFLNKDAQERLLTATKESQVEQIAALQRKALDMDRLNTLRKIDESEELSEAQKVNRKLLVEEAYAVKVKQLALDTQSASVNALNKEAQVGEGVFHKLDAGLTAYSKDAKIKFMDMANTSQIVGNALTNNFGQAFQAMGKSGAIFGQQMKNAIIGAIADVALAKGLELLASSIWPPNPIGLAAGAGLLALSGFLKSMVSGSTDSSTTSSAGGAPSVSAGGAGITPVVETPGGTGTNLADTSGLAPQSTQKRSVTINIAGNYFETEQTRTRLVELIRENADATDFKIQSIGGGI